MEQTKSKIEVTILITSYNAKKYLKRAVKSLLHQSCSNDLFEVIIVDDGSNDGSALLCNFYEKKYNNYTVVHQKNSGGPSRGRNKGIDLAKGKYIFFCDVDDYFGDKAIANMIDYINKWNSDVILCRMGEFNRNNLPRSMFLSNAENVTIYNSKIVRTLGPWKLFNVDFLRKNKIRFIENIAYEDSVFTLTAYFLANKISIASNYNYYYWTIRKDKSNLTLINNNAGFNFYKIEKVLNGVKLSMDVINKYNNLLKEQKEISLKVIEIVYYALKILIDQKATSNDFKKLYQITKDNINRAYLYDNNIDIIVLILAFLKNQNNDYLFKVYSNLIKGDYLINKKNSRFFVTLFNEFEITDIINKKIFSFINESSINNGIMSLNLNIYKANECQNLELVLLPNNDYNNATRIKLNTNLWETQNNISCTYNNAFLLLKKTKVCIKIDLKKFFEKNETPVLWNLYIYNKDDNSYQNIKINTDNFYELFYVYRNSICVPTKFLSSACILYINKKCNNEKLYYLKSNKSSFKSAVLIESLIHNSYEDTLTIAKSICDNSFDLQKNCSKKYYIYKNIKRIRIKNAYYIRKIIRIKSLLRLVYKKNKGL